MSVKLGINGFGRIGRYLLRLLADDPTPIGAINARADNASLAHLFKYDSCHGIFKGTVSHDDKGLIINGRHIPVTRDKIGEWKWKELGINLVIETSGTLKDRAALSQHLAAGAEKVIISAPCPDSDAVIVMNVNNAMYDPKKHTVISAASCTTNCLAPAMKVIHDNLGIVHGLMTTIHSYTMSQRILDGSNKDWRRARAAGVSMIPTSTGAARALSYVIPELTGKLDGMAVRVPTPNVSLVDVVCELEQETSLEAVNALLQAASQDPVFGQTMGYSEEPLVSIDYTGSTHGGVVDSLCTKVVGNRMLKLIIWYDNEAGFTNQLVRLIHFVGKDM